MICNKLYGSSVNSIHKYTARKLVLSPPGIERFICKSIISRHINILLLQYFVKIAFVDLVQIKY